METAIGKTFTDALLLESDTGGPKTISVSSCCRPASNGDRLDDVAPEGGSKLDVAVRVPENHDEPAGAPYGFITVSFKDHLVLVCAEEPRAGSSSLQPDSIGVNGGKKGRNPGNPLGDKA